MSDKATPYDPNDPASIVVSDAWPEYGGNHQPAEFWDAFCEGVVFTLKHPDGAAPEPVSEIWQRVFDGPYVPAVWGKHQAIRTENISQAVRIAQQRAPECADVIAMLVFWLGVERNRALLLTTPIPATAA